MSISARRKQKSHAQATPSPNLLTSSAENSGDGVVTFRWSYASDPSGGWTVGRDGNDSTGFGPWSTTVGGAVREQTFTSLVPGQSYTFTVSGDGKTSSTTFTVYAAPLTNFVANAASTTSMTLSWAYSGQPSASGFVIKRNGVQIATPAATATSYTDTGLTAGTSYTYTIVANFVSGGTSNTITASGATSGGTSGAYPANVLWLSGNSDYSAAQGATLGFGTFRGEPIRYVTAWDDPDNMGAFTYYKNAGYTGVLHSSKKAPEGWSWAAAASGSYDSFFNTYADALITGTTMREIHAGFGFELNGTWFAASIVRGSETGQLAQLGNFGNGWKRYANIMRSKASAANRNIKICLNLSWGNHGDASVRQIVQAAGTGYFDFLGVDYYDAYKPTPTKHLTNQTEWNNEYNRTKDGGNSPEGVGAWLALAASIGKPMTLPEWGLNDERALGPYDNPFYLQKMNEFFRTNRSADPGIPQAGKIYGEAYFNSENIGYLWPTTQMPNSRDMYQSLSWGQ